MRHLLAIVALVVSGLLLLLGIGQATFLAGPAEIRFSVDTQSDTAYAVIDAAELAKVPGQANVAVRGDTAFVATAASRDVAGWVAPFSHAELTVDATKQTLQTALVAPVTTGLAGGETDVEPLDPRGSDLWLSERSVNSEGSAENEVDTLRVPVKLRDDQSIIIASNGTDPMPADVALVWAQDRNTPWAGPLLAAGGLFALLGGVLYLIAVDHDRRGLGPRRGRRGPLQGLRNAFLGREKGQIVADSLSEAPAEPVDDAAPEAPESADAGSGTTQAPSDSGADTAGEKREMRAAQPKKWRRALVPAVGLTVALGLSGCSASYWPNLGGDTAKTTEQASADTGVETGAAPVPVTDFQIKRIVQNISAVSGKADETLDASELDTRFTGDALAQRTANYKIRKAMPKYSVVPPMITKNELDYKLVQSTETWPRTVFVTVESKAGDGSEDASPSLALVLRQENPHQNYLVSRIIALRGGISMPQAAPAAEGTAVLADDIDSFVLQPGKVGEAYAKLLQNGTDIPEAEFFDITDDALIENYGRARAAAAQKESDAKDQTMKFTATAKQGDSSVTALSTGAGGALVATTVVEEQIVDAAGGRFKPQAKDAVTALSGLKGEQNRLVQRVSHQMLFFVPSKTVDNGNSKITLLGVTSELVGASK